MRREEVGGKRKTGGKTMGARPRSGPSKNLGGVQQPVSLDSRDR